MLIAARALLGVAGATLAPSTLSLIRNMFHDETERTAAIGVWIASYSVGGAIGPVLGGIMLSYFWWGSVFLLAVPVMVLLLIVAPMLLPEFKDPEAGRLDIASAVLSLAAVLFAIYGIKQIAEAGVSVLALGVIAAGGVIGWVFVRRQARLPNPLIDLKLFKVPAFSAALATNLTAMMVSFAVFLLVAQYLQLVLGMGPFEAGLWSIPSAIGFTVGSMLAPKFVRRVRPAYVMAGGLLAGSAGFAMLSFAGSAGLAALVAGMIVLSLGLAPVVTLSTDLIVGSAPPENAGAASAISETGAEFGGALGIALLGSVAAAIYTSTMGGSMPQGVPPEAAAAARGNIGAAAAVAGDLSQTLGNELVSASRAAYAHAFQVATLISAAVCVVAACVTGAMLRTIASRSGAH
jgi:DHA2 family multidrug resistance protein-like MFS transporter